MNIKQAVEAPRIHHQWMPDTLDIEKGFAKDVIDSLEKMGYKTIERGGIGRIEAIKVLNDGRFEAVGDIRGDDDAEGY